MKRLSLLLMCLGWPLGLCAQACRPVVLATDSVHRVELRRYIRRCQQQGVLSKGKGLVQLTRYQDAQGLACWYLQAVTDERYTASPPAHYARVDQQLILVYQGDSAGNPLPLAGDSTARLACLREVVGGRVSPAAQPAHDPAGRAAGEKTPRGQVQQVSGGAPTQDLLLKFHKNGTVTRLQPV